MLIAIVLALVLVIHGDLDYLFDIMIYFSEVLQRYDVKSTKVAFSRNGHGGRLLGKHWLNGPIRQVKQSEAMVHKKIETNGYSGVSHKQTYLLHCEKTDKIV